MPVDHEITQADPRPDQLVSCTTSRNDETEPTELCISFEQFEPAARTTETAGAIFDMCKHVALSENASRLVITATETADVVELLVENGFVIDEYTQTAYWTADGEIRQVNGRVEAHFHIDVPESDSPCGCLIEDREGYPER
ncbi:hypothetical protein [Halobaculum sp. EA56]|uniref:hypothetical protein n=1 Tax=Halobaculum sp. EA56 TaxID=3421648 RepID=UPI003EB9597C